MNDEAETATSPDITDITAAAEQADDAASLADANVTVDFSALLLDTLGFTADEFVSIGHDNPAAGQPFSTAVNVPRLAIAYVAQLPDTANVFYGINPVEGPARQNAGRGTEADATRLAVLPVDLDFKPTGCGSPVTAYVIIGELSAVMGTRPSVIVGSGHGLHGYWPVADGKISERFTVGAAKALLDRWKYLVTAVAARHNAKVDSVFDLARMLRVPGTYNTKGDSTGILVEAHADEGGLPLLVKEIDAALIEAGITEQKPEKVSDTVLSEPTTWTAYTPGTYCGYVPAMIEGWAKDNPHERNPWMFGQMHRIAAALRLGCIDEQGCADMKAALGKRHCELLARGEPRKLKKFELEGAWMRAVDKVSHKTEEQCRDELGGHYHGFEGIWSGNSTQPPPQPQPEVPGAAEDDETVKTVPWPVLNSAALHGTPGKIVKAIAPHTEADPAAILVQLLAEFGATLGPGPHIMVGNKRHRAVINPLIVGATNSGAKGTSLDAVEAIRKVGLNWFDEFTTSGLSSAEGLIEQVRDPSGDPGDKDYDPGVADKRLLVKESEYRSVLNRCRREGNTLAMLLRQIFDGENLRTLTRKHNKLSATDPHIVIIGHITPREFRKAVEDTDMSGGSINRLLICLSRRSRLNTRMGNIPSDILIEAGTLFSDAVKTAQHRGEVKFTEKFWSAWEGGVYAYLSRDRSDGWATEATARAVIYVLRLAMIYALFDGEDAVDAVHLNAALALWSYCERSARWLFSSHEQEEQEAAGGLANFIREGGERGRTRTEISVDYFKRHKKAAEITVELTRLVHDGVVIEDRDETPGRSVTRYVHRDTRISELAKYAGQDDMQSSHAANYANSDSPDGPETVRKFADMRTVETPSDQHISHISLIRSADHDGQANSEPLNSSPDPAEEAEQMILCRFCGAEIPEHLHSARALGHCGKSRCIAAANTQREETP